MSIYKSIAKNYVANSIGLGIRFLNQIAMVPLFISFWGIDKYADWILITALSSFFSMTDMGLNTVTTNEFVIKYQQKEYFVCLKLLINTFLYITMIGIVVLLFAVVIFFTSGFKELLQISVFSEFETSFIFILLLFHVFMGMYNGAYHGIFRATSHAYIATTIESIVRLVELIILFVGIVCKINILIIIVLYVVPICLSIIYKHVYVQKWFKLKFSFHLVDFQLLKSLIKPSFAFVLTPLGYAISNQGMIFVVNALLGQILLVAFTTTRTLVNFLRSLMNLLGNAIWPEISVAYGKKELGTISTIYHRTFLITGILTLVCIILLCFIGKPIYLTWTKHSVIFDPVFFYGLLVVLFISCLWSITSVILLATNNHITFSIVFFIVQLMGVVTTFMALTIYPHLTIIPCALFLSELWLLWYVTKKTNEILHSRFRNFNLHDFKSLFVYIDKFIKIKHRFRKQKFN
jgi:O-antigen/teichoic acid export membrane protein